MEKGHYGQYTGNARHSKVTNSNMGATKRDDEAHMKYLKEDIDYDNKHGHSDSSMTSDEKHISKLAGDLKYDEKKHGSAAKMVSPLNDKSGKATQGAHRMTNEAFAKHKAVHDRDKDTRSRINEKAKMKTQPKLKNK
jgi:hypothetical protein|tara:strand:- start:29 stop:439 length:411 start_codon:yes stop_codon:yes gene_type:complete